MLKSKNKKAKTKRPGELSHTNSKGQARMVDVTKKEKTQRMAVASGRVKMKPATLDLIVKNKIAKGDVLSVARIAGIQAAKRTHELIPLCHPLGLTQVEVDLKINKRSSAIAITATVKCADRTGVEMEALTAAAVACLTIYDMAKAVDKGMVISDIKLLEKRGGKSGDWQRD
ncbi:MAG: cyclic pyranopterin monophosphate synthase MoaC [Candidatus Edwardsbacteria bacterium]|nr:cyclic pyranopterin monophosphate synthase MoaC [Candidatus Edwardsbacteria bacterium]MBU1576267.1 cyclic pyranopterin monophosphate synthase MoaC [Candidatus Edwardsbacteria bacterium]MBU2462666.1 cyclic pyranopterin monophosphate synthase MoaC [Candidatus Edwardsbacteria bacterium]MBU2594449.1 cyclic pyranopterin monophosphate synthase MoaC [Candidatus Edwardsbacteria bacterium]